MNIPVKGNLACKLCDSSDAVTLYKNPDNGSHFFKCYSCGKSYRLNGASVDTLTEELNRDKEAQEEYSEELKGVPFKESFRGLTPATLKFYGIYKDTDGNTVFPYHGYDKTRLATKIKYPSGDRPYVIQHHVTKGFQKSGLFGCHLFPPGGKYITVCEGELDAASAYQFQGSKYAAVSLKNGVNSILTQEDKKYLDSFEKVVYCGDNDEPGRRGAEKFASSFEKSKVLIVRLGKFKDTNDYLQEVVNLEHYGKTSEAQELIGTWIREWWNAKPWTPEGLVQGKNTLDLFLNETEAKSTPYPWQGLQEVLHGIRTSELIVVTAGSGSGKSALIRELAHHVFKAIPNEKIGCMFLEESLKRTVKDFVGMELGVNLRLPENVVAPEDRRNAWNTLFDNDRWIFWDHFGSNDIDTVCNQVRFIANNFGAKYIFLDHVSIIVSDGSHGDERKALDAVMTKLRTLVQELDICLFLVSHLRRSNDSTPHEEGGVTSLSQLRGSAGIGQLADIVIGLERNGQADNLVERNLTTLRILKNRFTGETGPACYLLWDKEKGRLSEVSDLQEVQRLITEEEQKYNKDLPVTQGV